MPVHDWTRVDAGLFHAFRQTWSVQLCAALNAGVLSPNYFALPEQRIRGPIPDVLTLQVAPTGDESDIGSVGLAVATRPPRARLIQRTEAGIYAARANRITVRHRHGEVVAVIEIVSPGNKSSRVEFKDFVEKAVTFIHRKIHFLVIDLFPPGPRDPQGIDRAIWDEFGGEESAMPPDKLLTVAAYDAGPSQVAYVEFLGIGDPLPDAPLFLKPETYVPAPLEASYEASWKVFPAPMKKLLESQKPS